MWNVPSRLCSIVSLTSGPISRAQVAKKTAGQAELVSREGRDFDLDLPEVVVGRSRLHPQCKPRFDLCESLPFVGSDGVLCLHLSPAISPPRAAIGYAFEFAQTF